MPKFRGALFIGGLAGILVASALGERAFANFRPKESFAPGTVPAGINYQGRLSNDGVLVTGQRNLRFRLYDHPTAGTMLWESGIISTQLEDGIFGAVLDIPAEALMGPGLKYLESEVGNIILLPREPFRAVPYARIAEVVEGAIEISSGSLAISTAAISGEAMYVSSATGQVGFGTFSPVSAAMVQVVGGDVQIGSPTLSNPSVDEDIFVPGNLVVEGSIFGGPGVSNRVELLVISTEAAVGERFKVGTALTVLDSGRVGMNTNVSALPLDIQSSEATAVNVNHASQAQIRLSRAGASRFTLEDVSANTRIQTTGSDDLILMASNAEVMRVSGGGNVGVSTGNPQERLDVQGNVRVTGSLSLGTALSISSGGTGGSGQAAARAALNLPQRDGTDAAGSWGINITGNAATFSAWLNAPSVCGVSAQFSTGIAASANALGCADASVSVDQSEGTNEPLIYDADNVLTGPWGVTSGGTADIFFDSPTFHIDVDLNRVGISTQAPQYKLDVEGGDVNSSAKIKEAGADLIPSGAITFSTIPAGCPAGWSEFVGARGFMVVGLPAGGSVGNTVGSALADLATSTHTHTLSAHTHTFTGPGHIHTPGGHTHSVDPATHDHGAGNHSHDNFDPDGGSPHSHTMTNSHTHSADPGATTMPANDNNSREGGVAGGPYNITGHSHTLNVPSFNTELGGPANTGTDNFTNKNSSTASGDRTAFFDISSQPSGVPSVDNTGSRAISNASASPSTDATDGKDVSFPYLQLWVCQKN